MKNTLNKLAVGAAMALAVFAASCTGKSTSAEPPALVAQAEKLDGKFNNIAENSPMFLDSARVAYADGTLAVRMVFATAPVDMVSQELVEYTVSRWIKANPGADLDEILNTLSAEKGSLKIELASTGNTGKEFTISAARLKKLLVLKPSELSFPQVKANVEEILAQSCAAYAAEYRALNAEFEVASSFAQYTLTFASANAYANLKQDSLRGRYQNVLRAQYENYGDCEHFIIDLLKSLNIDGYRFVYKTADGAGRELTAGLPWRIIE